MPKRTLTLVLDDAASSTQYGFHIRSRGEALRVLGVFFPAKEPGTIQVKRDPTALSLSYMADIITVKTKNIPRRRR